MRWQEVEDLVLELVQGQLPSRSKLKHAVARIVDRSERDVLALTEWLRQNSTRLRRGEDRITFDEANQLIQKFGYEFGNPDGSSVPILKVTWETRKDWLGRSKTTCRKQNVGTIGFPGGKREMGVSEIKKLRRLCRLTEDDGVDSDVFYGEGEVLDAIINKYRRTLRSLAHK
jgi:hypothetical protein